ncbi:MAG: addiction module protein [Limisphaerales bacterium]
MSVTAIQEEILGLPATERARLIDVLWNSISAPEQQAREAAWARNPNAGLTPMTPAN